MLEAIRYNRGALALLEQRKLPYTEEWVEIRSCDDGWRAIRDMTVRGAPAIAIAGMLSLAVELVVEGAGTQFESVEAARSWILSKLDYLATSRPTAVNLSIAVAAMKELLEEAAEAQKEALTAQSVAMLVVEEAEAMLRLDVSQNKVMGRHGADALLQACQARNRVNGDGKIRVLTHCNTGSLATAAYGTALGVVRALYERDALEHVYCTETRPYNQGARLTAFEIATDHMPGTLVCDSAVAALMRSNKVDAVVVGADRIAENGDTANKIGTFNIAVAAAYHNIPFFVAAPTTTVDVTLANGSLIPIEERSPEEITHFRGERVAAELPVWNPSFDVTPAAIIEGIVTELGVAWKTRPESGGLGGGYHLKKWLASNGGEGGGAEAVASQGQNLESEVSNEGLETRNGVPADFSPLTNEAAIEYVATRPHLAIHVGPADSAADWSVDEIGDGYLNYVFVVKGSHGAVCIKQSPPFVRAAGATWPLSQNRTEVEADALSEQGKHCPTLVPSVLHFDRDQHILVMQYIPPPHVGLRTGLCNGEVYPLMAGHLATFLSKTLFKTSYINMDTTEFRSMCTAFANEDLCALTEQVIYAEPYFASENNRFTPGLEDIVAEIQSNNELKLKVVEMKRRAIEKKQALLHGDLHSGSLLICPESTYVIDPEFANVGPIGFDVGKIMANLTMAYYAASARTDIETIETQRAWLLDCVRDIWTGFCNDFSRQWEELSTTNSTKTNNGDSAVASRKSLVWEDMGVDLPASVRERFLRDVWDDALGFFGCVIIRRIIGVAHILDFESIEDTEKRAACERRALRLAIDVLLSSDYSDIDSLLKAIQRM